MSANKNHPTEKMKNFIDKFSEKDIQILKIYNHGRTSTFTQEKTPIEIGFSSSIRVEMQ
jgi:hypothetical protein